MKTMIFAAALMLGGAAMAQDTQGSTSGSMQSGMSSSTTVAPGNQAPERDARGIPVVSAEAMAPAGWNQPPTVGGTGAMPGASAAPMQAAGDMPPCSRTVTDHCTQTYERGRARSK